MSEEIRKLQERKQKLLQAIENTKCKKKKVIQLSQSFVYQLQSGRLTRRRYEEKLKHALNNRSVEQWAKYYDEYVDYYKYQIKLCDKLIKESGKEKKKKLNLRKKPRDEKVTVYGGWEEKGLKDKVKRKRNYVPVLKVLIVFAFIAIIISLGINFTPVVVEKFQTFGELEGELLTLQPGLDRDVVILEQELNQHQAVIGEPVKWEKEIKLDSESGFDIELPRNTKNIKVKSGNQEIEFEEDTQLFSRKKQVIVDEERKDYKIEFETPAPEKEEEILGENKRVIVSGPNDIHYENVLSFAELVNEIPESEIDKIKIYEIVDGERVSVAFTAYDTNENNLLDYVEWITPRLSRAEFLIIIEISQAEHLDSDRKNGVDIYENVSKLDNVWSEVIEEGEYVRVTFEEILDKSKDITIYPRIISGNPKVEVYEFEGDKKIAEFSDLVEGKNTIYLTELEDLQDVFDLRIVDGSLELDHIVDPTTKFLIERSSDVELYATGTEITSSGGLSNNNVVGGKNLVRLDNDRLLALWAEDSDSYCEYSINKGITWGNQDHYSDSSSDMAIATNGSGVLYMWEASNDIVYGWNLEGNCTINGDVEEGFNDNAGGPDVAFDGSGSGKMVMCAIDTDSVGGYDLYYGYDDDFSNGINFEQEIVDTLSSGGYESCSIDVDDNGNVFIAVDNERDEEITVFNSSNNFASPGTEKTVYSDGVEGVHISIRGTTILVVSEDSGDLVIASSFDSGVTWSDEDYTGPDDFQDVEGCIDSDDDFHIISSDGSSSNDIWYVKYEAGFGTPIEIINTDDDLRYPSVRCTNFPLNNRMDDDKIEFVYTEVGATENAVYFGNYSTELGSSCGTLSTPNTVYTLMNNIVDNDLDGPCIIIAAQNITYDCDGNYIKSEDTYAGIYSNQFNTTIKNCNISMGSGSGGHGIELIGADYSYLENNNLNNNYMGILLFSSNNTKIIKNDIKNDFIGVVFSQGSSNNFIKDSNFSGNDYDVVLVENSINNTLLNTSYDISKESVVSGSLIRKWYYQANVSDENGVAIGGANVTAYNVTGSSGGWQFNLTSNLTGYTNITEIIEYVTINGNARNYYSNYAIYSRNGSLDDFHNLNVTAKTLGGGFGGLIFEEIVLDDIDLTPPSIDVISPLDGFVRTRHLTQYLTQDFAVNLTDDHQLVNATLYIWNSTTEINSTAMLISGKNYLINISVTLPDRYGDYEWNYYVCDNLDNCGWNLSNYTFKFGLNMGMYLRDADASFFGEGEFDASGSSVSYAGDVNGDGYDDLIIGAQYNNYGGTSAGQSYLIYGNANLSMRTNLSNANASFIGENVGDWLGNSVSYAGDVNGDGYDDLIIGVNRNDEGGNNAGQSYLIYGSSDLSMRTNLLNANASFIGEEADDYLGESASYAGDVNGDGYDDLIIGARGNEEGAAPSAGQSYLIYGSSSLSGGMDLSEANASFMGETHSEFSGSSVSYAGDVNGDGYDDLIIGATGNDEGGDRVGQSYLIYGSSDLSGGRDLLNANASFIGEGVNDYSGESVSYAGDVNGDGYDDLIIGAPRDAGYTGKSYLIYGSSDLSMRTNLSNANASFIGENVGDWLGNSASYAGDVNGDGYDDLIIGARGNDGGGDSAGQSYLIYGSSNLSGGIYLSNANASFIGESRDDLSGGSVSYVGDVNADGYDDLIIGASGGGGQSYLIYGNDQGFVSKSVSNLVITGKSDYSGQVGEDVDVKLNGALYLNLTATGGNPGLVDVAIVLVNSSNSSQQVKVKLIETGVDTNEYHGKFYVRTGASSFSGSKRVRVLNGSRIYVQSLDDSSYEDDVIVYYGKPFNEISECSDLIVANTYYNLTKNLLLEDYNSGPCINITTQNITFDCKGNYININENVAGVYSNQFNTTIKNCNISMGSGGVGYGIFLFDADNSYLENNILRDQVQGIRIIFSSEVKMIGNNIQNNDELGIFFGGSSNNFIKNCNISGINPAMNLIASYNNTFLNTSYDLAKENVNTGSLIRKWYYQANISDINDVVISGANLSAYNITGSSGGWQFNLTSNLTGYTNITEIIEYVTINGNTRNYYSNYTIKTIKDNLVETHRLNVTAKTLDGDFTGLIFEEIVFGGGTDVILCRDLDVPNTVYTQITHIPNGRGVGGTCINITAQNITFDCQGNYINIAESVIGVFSNQFNTTIKNCNISTGGSGTGIRLENLNNATIINNSLNNQMMGLDFSNVYYSLIENNTLNENMVGIGVWSSSSNNILKNNSLDSNMYGVFISEGSKNFLINNTIKSSNQNGIWLTSTNNNRLIGNNLWNNNLVSSYGAIALSSSSNNIISGGLIDESGNSIYLEGGSNDNNFTNIILTDALFQGVFSESSLRNRFDNLTISDIDLDAFRITNSPNSFFINNSITNVGLNAFNVKSSQTNSFINNSITNVGLTAFNISYSQDNSFTNNSITNANLDYYFQVDLAKEYGFKDNSLEFNNTNGTIRFLNPITANGADLSNVLKINYDNATVYSDIDSGFNVPANITLYRIPTDPIDPLTITKDGVFCPDCYNFTSLTAGTVKFNVTGFTSYSIETLPDVFPPLVKFESTTNPAGDQNENSIFINASAEDTFVWRNNVSVFIDFDNSLVGWWRMDEVVGGKDDYETIDDNLGRDNCCDGSAWCGSNDNDWCDGADFRNVGEPGHDGSVNPGDKNRYNLKLGKMGCSADNDWCDDSHPPDGYGPDINQDGIVGEVVYDNSSYGHDGIVYDDAYQLEGKMGKGMKFDGDGDYIGLGSSQDLSANPNLTFSSWVKLDAISEMQVIMGKYAVAPKRGYSFLIGPGGGFGIRIGLGENSECVVGTGIGPLPRPKLEVDKWYYVTGIIEKFSGGPRLSVYLDGVFIRSENCGIGYVNSPYSAGMGSSVLNEFFNGIIDDAMLFNRVLSNEEIKGLYANTSKGYAWNDFTNLETREYNFKAYAQDDWGNVNMTERNIEVADLTSPQIKFEDLTPGNENLDQDFIPINVSASDINGGDNNVSVFIDFNKSLVGWWRMDDYNDAGIYDNSSYENFGTFGGTLGPSDVVDGKMGNAMEFDGDGDYVDLGDDTFDDISEAYTISVWTYPKDFKYGSRVISLEGWIGTIYGYSFKWYYSVYNGTENIAINSDDDFELNKWKHIVTVYNGSNIFMYVDGILQNDIKGVGGSINNGATRVNVIGANYARNNYFFNGSIDDVMIFNGALSPAEIAGLYANQSSKILFNNFTDLVPGNYTFKAYAQDAAGNVNMTQEREAKIKDPSLITDCRDITLPGVYKLEDDILSNDDCFIITSSDVELDCKGHLIEASSSFKTGIYVDGSLGTLNNITIKNCIIDDFYYGMNILNMNDSFITNISIISHPYMAFSIVDSDYNLFSNLSMIGQTPTTGTGLFIEFSNYNNFTEGTIEGNDRGLFLRDDTTYNRFSRLNITNNDIGIDFEKFSATNNFVYENLFNNAKNEEHNSGADNFYNMTKDCSQTNIIGGDCIGGNYWAEPDGTGGSETCRDTNRDGFCDGGYNMGDGEIDYLALTYILPDFTAPAINFTFPTPANKNITFNNFIPINVSVNDSQSDVSVFIDFNKSLVGWWRMDDLCNGGSEVCDNSSYGNNGIISGVGNDPQQVEGYLGKAMEFDGEGDYVKVSSINQNSVYGTLSAWINIQEMAQNDGIFVTSAIAPWITAGSASRFRIRFYGDGVGDAYDFNVYPPLNQWTHFVLTWNDVEAVVYIDGQEDTKGIPAFALDSALTDLYIAKDRTQPDSEPSMLADDVMIFNRVLSPEEIAGLYANQSSKILFNNFDNLETGNYTFKAYVQDLEGNVNMTESRNVSVESRAPKIINVRYDQNIIPSEGTVENVTINFTVYDINGYDTLDHGSSMVNLSLTGYSVSRENLSCSFIEGFENYANYSCTVGMWYFDEPGYWNINISIKDADENVATNDSESFLYEYLASFMLEDYYAPSLSWSDVVLRGSLNQLADDNRFSVFNLGNVNITGINLTAYDLIPAPGDGSFINVSWFRFKEYDPLDPGDSCTVGLQLENKTNKILDLNISFKYSTTTTPFSEDLEFCLTDLIFSEENPITLQEYSTSDSFSWNIEPLFTTFMLSIIRLIKFNLGLALFALAVSIKNKKRKLKIPLSIFSLELSPAESLCKYLRDEGYSVSEIAKLIKRDKSTISINYKNAIESVKEKLIEKFDEKIDSEKELFVDINIFSDRRLSVLESVVKYLKEDGYRNVEIARMLDKDERNISTLYCRVKIKLKKDVEAVKVPLIIFKQKISPAEALCKYLRDNKRLKFKEIAELINRNESTIWTEYNYSKKKLDERVDEDKELLIEVKIFSDRRLSILESVIYYLRKDGYRNVEIARMLDKDERNISTLYSRIKKKIG